MSKQTLDIQKLLEAGGHFGHLREKWHPAFQPFIFTTRNNVHIIDLEKTIEQAEKAKEYIQKLQSEGKTILFVGTKRQIRDIVKDIAIKLGMPYIDYRWLGGTLTNFETIEKALKSFKEAKAYKENKEEFEKLTKKEQKVFNTKLAKMERSFGGIEDLKGKPDALFVIDGIEEKVAVSEAKVSEVPIVGIIDTNADPNNFKYPIPLNDDSKKAIEIVLNYISEKSEEKIDKPKIEKKNSKKEGKKK